VTGWIQAKLTVSQPGDADEREADRVADQIMRMPTDHASPVTIATSQSPTPSLERCACDGCAREEKVQRKGSPDQAGGSVHRVDSAIGSRIDALRGTGQPLGREERGFFEPRLGVDLSHVRVHSGGEATAAATALHARAFTVGRDVVFGAGQFAPATTPGRSLLAHELTHVVQQGRAATSTSTVQRKCSTVDVVLAAASGDYGALAGEIWLCLDEADKTKYIDAALKGAARVLNKLPDDPVLGILWPMFRAGLIGFVHRLQQPAVKPEEKVKAMDKLATIIAGKSSSFNVAYLKGLAKGFFVDGALGIFILIYDLIQVVPGIWHLFDQLETAIEGFPDDIVVLVNEFKALHAMLLTDGPTGLAELKQWASDPAKVLNALSSASAEIKGFLNDKGGDLAESLVKTINKPGSETALGETAGAISGQILWEVVFAVLTAGGGAAVTAAKESVSAGVAVLKKVVGKVVGSFLKLFSELKSLLEPVAGWISKAAKAIKGKAGQLGDRFAGLLKKLRDFFVKILGSCHESKIVCPPLKKGKNSRPKPGSRTREFEPPIRDHGGGKAGGVLPASAAERAEALNSWSKEELELAAKELEKSVIVRQAEQGRLGETSLGPQQQPVGAAHRRRISDELALLRAIQKKLSGS